MFHPIASSPSGLLNLNTQNVPSKIHLEGAHPSTITTDENVEAVERIEMRDRKISVHCITYELIIQTTTVYEMMSNHLGMKKISTRWIPKLFTPLQRSQIVVKNFCKRAK